MAKQAGAIKITGTIDDLTFYKMLGDYYVRMKSSLTGKRFWKDKAFEGSRKSCSRFGEGNSVASKVYAMVEEEKRVYKLFCFLKRKAILLLKDGCSLLQAEEVLVDYLKAFGFIEKVAKKNKGTMRRLPIPGVPVPKKMLNPVLIPKCLHGNAFKQESKRCYHFLNMAHNP